MKRFLPALLMLLPLAAFAYVSPGAPTGFVNDFTGTLTESQRQALEQEASNFEKATSHEIAVAIIGSLGGDTIENFAEKLFSEWGIGKAGRDNGVLILVAKEDREMRIEVGYGLEGDLTDLQSFWVIDNIMKPAFQAGDFYGGLEGVMDRIIEAIQGGEPIPAVSEGSTEDTIKGFTTAAFFSLIFGFRIVAIVLGRSKSWWGGGVLGAVIGLIAAQFIGSIILNISILVPLGLLFDFLVSRSYNHAQAKGVLPWWWFVGRGGSGHGRGGFGGFGGGRSGGGGASGRW